MTQFARPAFVLAILGAVLSGCATTGATGPTTDRYLNARPASAEDCAVISMTLELFSRPADGSPLKVSDVALPVTPSFRPQRPEQVANEPLSLRGCRAIQAEFVAADARVVLSRPEIHDDGVFVRYRENDQPAVFAKLERTAEGHWRHVGAYPTAY